MYEFLSTLRTTLSNYSFDLPTSVFTTNNNQIYLTKSQIDILNKFSNYYPSSIIRDVTVTKLVNDISLQGQIFKKLTTSSIRTSADLSKSMYFIIDKLDKTKFEDLLVTDHNSVKINNDIRIWVDSEVLLSEVMKRCDQTRSEYTNITNSLNTIQHLLQERKTAIINEEKKLVQNDRLQNHGATKGALAGLGLGTAIAIPLSLFISPFDGGITLISTTLMGGIIGAVYHEKDHDDVLSDKKQAKTLLLKEDQKYIDSVVVDVKEIRKSVGVFENYWLNQFNLIGDSKNLIINKKNNIINDKFSTHSILKSWIQARKYFDDYQQTVTNLQ
nr:10391_t:CDS:1 [Entrophospora candida]